MKSDIIKALKFLILMTILTGIIYPVLTTGMARILFPHKANGSLVYRDGKIIGSELLGQLFDSSVYFWPRPSASNYETVPSGASNLGPTSMILKSTVHKRILSFAEINRVADTLDIPPDMLFASASGLDPDISPASAFIQIKRISRARDLDNTKTEQLNRLVKEMTEKPQFMIFGERRVNVLKLNIELDRRFGADKGEGK
jgi:potassium-transporting ATPase KdpC subunit